MRHSPAKSVLTRLKKIEGQVRGVAGMVEENRYCMDILTQVQAIKAALSKVEDELLKNHAVQSVEEAIRDGDAESQRQKFSELVELFGKYRG
jgi:CsoR family transcriptional regulator, copper-sensing transcriptional repressor